MNDRVRIAKELVRIARELAASWLDGRREPYSLGNKHGYFKHSFGENPQDKSWVLKKNGVGTSSAEYVMTLSKKAFDDISRNNRFDFFKNDLAGQASATLAEIKPGIVELRIKFDDTNNASVKSPKRKIESYLEQFAELIDPNGGESVLPIIPDK